MVWGFDLLNIIKFNKNIDWKRVFNIFAITQIFYVLTTMLLTRVVFCRYYSSNQYSKLALAVAGLIVYFIFVRYFTEEILVTAISGASNYSESTPFLYYVLDNINFAVIYIFLGFLVFLLDYQVGLKQKASLLIQQNREAELAFLRSQVSPHFLFNSLNNIYALSYKKSDKAPEAILKLSDLVRFMLYEKQEEIPLSKEWEYVQNLIGLQQLRYSFPLQIETTVKGEPSSLQIAPYLLIPFVENLFKHARLEESGPPVQMLLQVDGKQLDFSLTNTISNGQKDNSGGIGLPNISRRLELLYPGRHQLIITNNEQVFSIHLTINLQDGNKNSSSR